MTVDVVVGLKWYIVFLFSTTFHEAAHAWAAYRLGDDTAHRGGQVTLDPTPHIRREPFGMVVVPLLSFLLGGWMIGWASTPISVAWAVQHPKRCALMSLAGPLSNLALVLGAALAIRIGMAAGVFQAPASPDTFHIVSAAANASGIFEFLAAMISIVFLLNLLLCVFNLLPVPPLDGFRACFLFVPRSAAQNIFAASGNRSFAWIGLLVAWRLFDVAFTPIRLYAVNLLYVGAGFQ